MTAMFPIRGLLCLTALVLFASPIHAVNFTPHPCSTTVPLEVDWPFDSLDLEDGFEVNGPLQDSGGGLNYSNNISNTRHFFANSYVDSVEFHATIFQTEATYDRLSLKQGSNASYIMSHNTTTPFWTNYTGGSTLTDVLQYRGVAMNFKTDSSITKRGFAIDKVRVKCRATAGSNLPNGVMIPGQRHTGVLLAQDDVVNFTYYSPIAGHRVNIALWGPPAANRDIDLYVRCGAMPTPSSFSQAAVYPGTTAFLSVTTSVCADPYALRITVHNKGTAAAPFNIMGADPLQRHQVPESLN